MSNRVEITVEFDVHGRPKIVDAQSQVRKLGDDTDRTSKRMRGADAAAAAMERSIRAVGAAAVAALSVKVVIDFGQAIFDAGRQVQALEMSLKTSTGSSAAARVEMAFLRREADRLGLDLYKSASGFQTIAAAAMGTNLQGQATRDIFRGVVEAMTAMNRPADDVQGALLAISQMISKGTVQAEELRGQLGERIPGAFQIAARSMGVTTAELGKMLEQGQVVADEFLPRFAVAMHEQFGRAAMDASDSATAAVNRFNTAWMDLKAEMAQAGFLDAVVADMEQLTEMLKDPELRSAMREIASLAGDIALGIGQAAQWAVEYGPAISKILAAGVGNPKGLFKSYMEWSTGREIPSDLDVLRQLLSEDTSSGAISPEHLREALALGRGARGAPTIQSGVRLSDLYKPELMRGAQTAPRLTEWDVEQAKLHEKLVEKINKATMKRGDFARQQLEKEVADLERQYGKQEVITKYYQARMAEIAKDERDKGGRAASSQAKKLARERLKLKEELTDEINRLTMTETDYQLWALAQQVAKYRAAHGEMTEIAEYEAAKQQEILERKLEAEREFAVAVAELNDDVTARELANIEKRKEAFIQAGIDRAKAEKLAAEESKKVIEEHSNTFSSAWSKSIDDINKNKLTGEAAFNSLASIGANAINRLNGVLLDNEMTIQEWGYSVVRQLADVALQMSALGLVGWAGGGGFSRLFETTVWSSGTGMSWVMHGGGRVGTDGSPRQVPDWLFYNAPRLHDGLRTGRMAGDPARRRGSQVAGRRGARQGGRIGNQVSIARDSNSGSKRHDRPKCQCL
jgi:tape measure domain-containing protein